MYSKTLNTSKLGKTSRSRRSFHPFVIKHPNSTPSRLKVWRSSRFSGRRIARPSDLSDFATQTSHCCFKYLHFRTIPSVRLPPLTDLHTGEPPPNMHPKPSLCVTIRDQRQVITKRFSDRSPVWDSKPASRLGVLRLDRHDLRNPDDRRRGQSRRFVVRDHQIAWPATIGGTRHRQHPEKSGCGDGHGTFNGSRTLQMCVGIGRAVPFGEREERTVRAHLGPDAGQNDMAVFDRMSNLTTLVQA